MNGPWHRSRRGLSKLFFLGLVLLGPPVPAQDEKLPIAPAEAGQFVPVHTDAVKNTEIIDVEITEEHFRPPVDWEVEKNKVLRDLDPPFLEELQNMQELLASMGQEALIESIKAGRPARTLPGVGRLELNQVDDTAFIRAVHEPTKVSLLYLDADRVSRKSEHLSQIIARQHIDAGDADPQGRKPGRDVVLVWLREGRILETEYYPRHIPGTPPWWADYWRSTWKSPKKADVVLGSFCAAIQMATAACVSTLRVHLNPETAFETAPILLSGIFGLTIGTFGSTYRNWTYRGSAISKIGKLSLVSLIYAYSLTFMREGGATVFRFFDPSALLVHAHLWTNTVLNNWGRSAWQKLPEIRNWMRKNTGTLKLGLFGKQFDTGVSRATFENQMIYLVPFTLKLIGLVGLGVGITVPFTSWNVDSGTLMLIASIPLAQFLVMKYAERNHFPNAAEIRKRWEELRRLPFRLPKQVYLIVKDLMKEMKEVAWPVTKGSFKSLGQALLRGCRDVLHWLGGGNTPQAPAAPR